MAILIIFDTENSAFEDNQHGETHFVLNQICPDLRTGGALKDSNGNNIGSWVNKPIPDFIVNDIQEIIGAS